LKQSTLQNSVVLLWIIFAVVFCVGAVKLKVGTPAHPEPGFMPLLVGIFLGAVSILTLIKALRARGDHASDKNVAELFSWGKFRKTAVMCVAVFGYALLLPSLGYLVSTFALMLIMFKGLSAQRWGATIIESLLSVILSYYLFVVWLGCQVPSFPRFMAT